jgi:hypothetical protein
MHRFESTLVFLSVLFSIRRTLKHGDNEFVTFMYFIVTKVMPFFKVTEMLQVETPETLNVRNHHEQLQCRFF